MKTLQDLEIFVHTADLGSLSAAARRLDLTPAAASAALKRLETSVQAPLFLRSTRSLRLTAEGEVFLLHCRQALDLLADGREAVASGRSVVRGVLQLSLPSDLGRNVLLPWLDAYQQQHPEVALRLQLSDRLADVYRQPVDLTIRYGTLPDSSLVALPLMSGNRRVLCASPAYLAQFGRPASPAALGEHNCLCFMLGDVVHDRWRFFRDGQEASVLVHGDRVSDDGDVVHRWALAGHGLAYKSWLDVHADVQAGRLVAVCQDWQGEPAPLNLLCADRRQLSPAVQQLRDFLMPRLAALVP